MPLAVAAACPLAARPTRWRAMLCGVLLAAGAQLLLLHPGVALAASAVVDTGGAPLAKGQAAAPTDLERALVESVNADRRAHGLAPLFPDPSLLAVARQRAAAQVGQPSLSHYDRSGEVAIAGLLANAGVTYRLAGENLARLPGGDSTVASRAEIALLNSPTHRANILDPRFDRLAVGAALDQNGFVVYAQIFRATVPDPASAATAASAGLPTDTTQG